MEKLYGMHKWWDSNFFCVGLPLLDSFAILATRTDKTLSHRSYDSLPFSGKGSNSSVLKKRVHVKASPNGKVREQKDRRTFFREY